MFRTKAELMKRRIVVVIGLALTMLMLAAAPAFAYRMVIHEIYYNSPGVDDGSNASLNGEWVQLHNTSGQSIVLTGWTVRDASNHVYTFGPYTIGPYKYVKIHTGSGTNTATDRYQGRGWYIWNNTGTDTGTIKNSSGVTIDACTYTGTSVSYKIC